MKSRGRRLLSVLMALALCLGMLPGAVWAEGEKDITFPGIVQNNNGVTTVTYNVNNTDVVVTLKSNMTIDMENGQDGQPKKTLTLDGSKRFLTDVVESISTFDSETMEIRAMGSNNFSTTLTWNSTSKQFTLPDNAVLPDAFTFTIQPKNSNPQPPVEETIRVEFENVTDCTDSSVTIAYDESTSIVVTISGTSAKVADNGNSEQHHYELIFPSSDKDSVRFTLDSHYDAETMKAVVRGADGYRDEVKTENDGTLSFNGLNFPGGGIHFSIERRNSDEEHPDGPGPGNEHTFSGTAYFVWDNGSSLGIKKIENLKGRGQSGGYEINYINASDFGFANGVSVGSLAENGHYFWVAEGKVTETGEDANATYSIRDASNTEITTWSALESYINSLGEDGKRAFAYDPTGGRNGTHSISTNGDRNFRATIYESGFEGIQFSADMSDYTYFPGFWDPTFFSSTIDISGSTKTYPAIYETYLREPNITFYNVEQSTSPITAVKALDVPDGVVTVTGDNGGFTITFQSNYYDHVVFELTAENNAKYYVMLARTVLQAHDNFGPDMTWTPEISAEVWYPSSDVAEGKDECPYEVVAYVHYNDESTVVQKLSAVQMPVEEGSSEMKFVLTPTDGAKGLSYSTFTLPIGTAGQRLDEITVVGISYTVVKKGSSEDFSGVMSGSGRGTYYDVDKRMIDYWK